MPEMSPEEHWPQRGQVDHTCVCPPHFSYAPIERIVHASAFLARVCIAKLEAHRHQEEYPRNLQQWYFVTEIAKQCGCLQRRLPERATDPPEDLMIVLPNAPQGLRNQARIGYIYHPQDQYHDEYWEEWTREKGQNAVKRYLTDREVKQIVGHMEHVQPIDEGSGKLEL